MLVIHAYSRYIVRDNSICDFSRKLENSTNYYIYSRFYLYLGVAPSFRDDVMVSRDHLSRGSSFQEG